MHIAFFTVRMRKGFGVDLVVDRWARGLLDERNPVADRVTVFCFDYDGETYKDAPYEIEPLHLSRDKANKFLPLLEADTANTVRRLKREIESGKREKIDVAMPASFPFYGAGRILGVPTVHLHFGNPPTAGLKWWTRINRGYLDRSDVRHMRQCERIIAISAFLKNELPQDVRAKTDVVHPGADHLPHVSDDAVKAMRERLERETTGCEGEVFVLSVSRLDYKAHPYKGVLETAKLVNELCESGTKIKLVLAGVGARASIAELRARGAIVIEAPSFDELAALYRACDIFVSLSSWEGFGLPVAEAATAGMPTIALSVAAHRENAVAYPVASIAEAAQAISELAANPDLRREKGAQAAETARRYTWRKSCDEFAEAFISRDLR